MENLHLIALSASVAAIILGGGYFSYLEKRRRLELLHAERLAAIEKGIPLPELPVDPLAAFWARPDLPHLFHPPPNPRLPLFIGVIIGAFGLGSMIAFSLVPRTQEYWPLPLPFALIGVGLMLYYFLAGDRTS